MYKEFYGFTTYPFALSPDTQFLYPSENFKDCLFYLLHGLHRGYGILVMTGAIGTGKTFLLHTLIKKLGDKTHAAFIVNSALSSFEILQYASNEFKLEITGQSKAELLLNLREFLLTHAMVNEKVILIVDEAQNLSVEVLEEIRLLTNFENSGKKLIQIILSGQVELTEKLKLSELTQFSQRVDFSCHLIPLNYEETKSYIESRLSTAGVTEPLFTSKVIKEIYVFSKGIPRVINLICDHALLFGFINETHEIVHTTIQAVMQDLNGHTTEQLRHRHTRPQRATDVVRTRSFRCIRRLAIMAALVVVSLLSAGVLWHSPLVSHKLKENITRSEPSSVVVVPPSSSVREPPLLPQSPSVREPPLLPQSPSVREPPPSRRQGQAG
jgi:general secretion pathway protein A